MKKTISLLFMIEILNNFLLPHVLDSNDKKQDGFDFYLFLELKKPKFMCIKQKRPLIFFFINKLNVAFEDFENSFKIQICKYNLL